MKINIVTVGEPKLAYARAGWQEYSERLQRLHAVQTTHLADKYAYDAAAILRAADKAYKVALVIEGGREFSSPELAQFLEQRSQHSRQPLCFIIGGPEGLPPEVIEACELKWSFSRLTFPHDLAMVILLEALYRATTIAAGHPYHKA